MLVYLMTLAMFVMLIAIIACLLYKIARLAHPKPLTELEMKQATEMRLQRRHEYEEHISGLYHRFFLAYALLFSVYLTMFSLYVTLFWLAHRAEIVMNLAALSTGG